MKPDSIKIATWELMRNLRNKQYIISLLVTPLIMVVFIMIPRLLEKMDKPTQMILYVVDELGIAEELQQTIPVPYIELKAVNDREGLQERVYREKASGYLIIGQDFWESGQLVYHYNKLKMEEIAIVQSVLTQFLRRHRMEESKINPEQVSYLTASADIEKIALEKAEAPQKNAIIVSLVFMGLIFFLIFTSGTMLMQSALQERRDRMAEIVLSSVKASSLMQGKIIGHFVLGLIQLIFWIGLSLPAVLYFMDFPLVQALKETNMAIILFFGMGGYLLFSSIYVSMGATMDDIQSAGNTQSLIMMIPMLSILFLSPVIRNPEGTVARFASLFPLTSPFVMIARSVFTKIPLWEVLLSAVLLLISIYLLSKLAAKIFRVGMLMYGKTANFAEIIKWVKYKER